MTLQEKIAAAIGSSWENFKARHPSQAEAIEHLGDPVELICDQLAEDQPYLDLVAQTEAETSIKQIMDNIKPFFNAAMGVVMAL